MKIVRYIQVICYFFWFILSSSKNSSHICYIAHRTNEYFFIKYDFYILDGLLFCTFKSLMCMIWFMENTSLGNHKHTFINFCIGYVCICYDRKEFSPHVMYSSLFVSWNICIYKNQQKCILLYPQWSLVFLRYWILHNNFHFNFCGIVNGSFSFINVYEIFIQIKRWLYPYYWNFRIKIYF